MAKENKELIEQQEKSISEAGNRPNPGELGLEENSKQYKPLFKKGMSKETLARKILEKRTASDKKDYFKEKEQLQKANSYAEFLVKEAGEVINDTTKEHEKDMKETRKNIEQQQKERIDSLKKLLNDAPDEEKKGIEVAIKLLEKELETIRTSKANLIDEIKNNKTTLEKGKEELKKLNEDKEKLEKNFRTSIDYKDNIKVDNKKFTSKMYRLGAKETDEYGRKKIVGLETMPMQMARRRMTIKAIANHMNQIKTDAKLGVDYIMAFKEARMGRYFRMSGSMNRRELLRKMKMGRNLETFGKNFAKQKEKIINRLTTGIDVSNLPKEEQEIIKAIKERIDYYGKKYLQDIFTGTKMEKEPK